MSWVFPFADKFITGHFGKIRSFRSAIPHRGTDYAPGEGALIPSIADGICYAITFEKGLGWTIETLVEDKAGESWFISYSHCQDKPKKLKVGDTITAGVTHVARVGNTGTLTTGAHVHICLYKKPGGYKFGKVYDVYKKIKSEQA